MRRPIRLRRPVEEEVLRREREWHRRRSERLINSLVWVGGGNDDDEQRKAMNLLRALFFGVDLQKGGNEDESKNRAH